MYGLFVNGQICMSSSFVVTIITFIPQTFVWTVYEWSDGYN